MKAYQTPLPINKWEEADRPREKLLHQGKSSLTKSELLAIILGSGSNNQSALELAKVLLTAHANSLKRLSAVKINELTKFKGIGPAKAISIHAALELGKRTTFESTERKPKITSSELAADQLFPLLADLDKEEFWVLELNRQNQLITKTLISSGGVSGTVVDAKLVFKSAINNLASAIILGHNHPSGNTKPSDADLRLTRKLVEAGRLLDIAVLDHIIIARENFTSLNDDGLMT